MAELPPPHKPKGAPFDELRAASNTGAVAPRVDPSHKVNLSQPVAQMSSVSEIISGEFAQVSQQGTRLLSDVTVYLESSGWHRDDPGPAGSIWRRYHGG